MNEFQRDLEWSHNQAEQPWWDEVYRTAFPNFVRSQVIANDGWAQRGGIDRLVILSDGTTLKVDEKSRREAWPDFLLEYWSDEGKRIPGWISKPLTCDFIAYAFVPIQTCYLLPFQTLRAAGFQNRHDWVQRYKRVEAQNPRYKTVSVAVPIDVVLAALTSAMVVQWTAKAEAA